MAGHYFLGFEITKQGIVYLPGKPESTHIQTVKGFTGSDKLNIDYHRNKRPHNPDFKDQKNEHRQLQKEMEALENRLWYEKTWDTVNTFTGEVTDYFVILIG